MWPNNALGLLVNLGYYVLVLWLTDEARRHLRVPREWTSRAIQLGLAIFIAPTLTFFSTPWWGIVVPALLAIVLALAGKRARERGRADRMRQTVFMLAGYAVLTVVFWSPQWRFVTAVAILSSAFALVAREVGNQWWTRDQFALAGDHHSLEAVLFSALVLAGALTLTLSWFAQLDWVLALVFSALLALVGTLAAVVSVRETAHATLPIVLALLLFVLVRGGIQAGPALQLIVGVALASLIALAGLVFGALSPSGAAGAIWIGTFVFGLGGWHYAAPLVVFFVGSSLLSRLPRPEAGDLAGELTGKNGRRTLSQTIANGGVAAALAAVKVLAPDAVFAAFLGAIAAANADTWATEIGTRARSQARSLIGWRPVPIGTSGAVTLPGSLATAAGALVVGLTGALFGFYAGEALALNGSGWGLAGKLLAASLVGGVLGSLVDSLLGATLQGVFRCPECGEISERRRHGCARPGEVQRGWRWVDNDVVNFLATLSGALLAWLTYILL